MQSGAAQSGKRWRVRGAGGNQAPDKQLHASDSEYAAVLAAMAPLRDGSTERNALISFLFPDRQDWVDQDVLPGPRGVVSRGERAAALLAGALSTVEQGLAFAQAARCSEVVGNRTMANVLAGLGTRAVPMLEHWLDAGDGSSAADIHGLLARIPCDTAFARLLAVGPDATPQLIAAAERFPRRGTRMLAEAAPKDATMRWTVAYALRRQVLARRELAEETMPMLGNAARARIKALLELTAAVPDAEPDTLPVLLVKPPWVMGQKPAKQVVFRELVTSAENEMAWRSATSRPWSRPGRPPAATPAWRPAWTC
ncbi:hypothetical protein ABH920_003495 [Catenulispora sp. EB89]|uniref:hypothetical protein n=1 Tax=Catenulispora sp. EB89 TaxID=3156257 RepID=UPI0035170B92